MATETQPFDQRIRIAGLRLGAAILFPLLFLAHPLFQSGGLVSEVMEVVGILLLIAGVLGRFWSILYVGGRKNSEVMTDGPYSMTRNPLYFFSTVGVLGIGLMFGMLTLALLLAGAVFLILYLTARREQAFLVAEFGDAYREYAARVPMFIPDPRLFRTASRIEVATTPLRRNLQDALVFLSAIPIAEFAEVFHERVDILHILLP